MKALYKQGEANFPRLSTDKFFINYENTFNFDEITDKTMKFTEDYQLLKTDLWIDFVEQFSDQIDGTNQGWRGEYWGKMMRGGCFVYSYTKNQKLLKNPQLPQNNATILSHKFVYFNLSSNKLTPN